MPTALTFPTITGVTGAPNVPNLTEVADIQAALKYLYFGSTGVAATTDGIYGALHRLYVGDPTLSGNVTITGTLTVNGTTTTINSTTLNVDDKLIELGAVTTPSNTTADGGGISLLGATAKTILWDTTNANWTSSEHFSTQVGKAYRIGNAGGSTTNVISGTAAALLVGENASTSLALGNTSGATTLNGTITVNNPNRTMAHLMGYTSTATAAGTTTLTNTSSYYQQFTGTLTQTVVLPVTSTLATGWTFHIVNNSTGNLTVNSSGGNLVITVIPGTTAMVTCIGTTLTTAADWESGLTDFSTYTGSGNVVMSTSPTLTNITTAAGTTSLAPIRMTQATAGTWLSTPLGGAIESTVEASYLTVANGPGRGIIRAPQMVYRVSASGTTVNTATSIFDTTNDVLSSLEANKLYRFKGTVFATFSYGSPNGSNLQLGFAFSNAPVTFVYNYRTYAQTASTTPLVHGGTISSNAATSVTAQLTASASYVVEFEGYIVTNATLTSTFTPQFQGNAATVSTWAVGAGSYLEIEKLGTNAQTLIAGNWA